MKLAIQCVIVKILLVVSPVLTIAHEGHDHSSQTRSTRIWTFKDMSPPVHGAFVSSVDGKVQIRREDGIVVPIDTAKLVEIDQEWIDQKVKRIRKLNDKKISSIHLIQTAAPKSDNRPGIVATFEPFAKLNAIKYRQDNDFFYVESNGIPDHRMMVGITAWQQQVPIPQSYFGDNSWRIPLFPIVAKNPMSAKSNFFRGAIALAANGVPIFNPIKNDGRTDTLLAGELDEFGGHCGRGDDYHYHIAPTHLQEAVGAGTPIAYALDGYPIYGYTEPDGKAVKGLDAFNGHETPELGYHYHATKTYPYLNGGFHGEVIERGGQVDPQPRASSVRQALPPLRGAKIIGFDQPKPDSYKLTYDIQGKKGTVSYLLAKDGSAEFTYVEPNGRSRTENYAANRRGGGGGGRGNAGGGPGPDGRNGGNDRPPPPPPRNDQRPPQRDRQPPANNPMKESSLDPTSNNQSKGLVVSSPAFEANGLIPADYTCDGASASPPINWKGAPEGTKSFAVSLWHNAPDQVKSYWLIYNIPSGVSQLQKNAKATGTMGLNDKKRAGYDPMCSKGPGIKKYHITVYALSSDLDLNPKNANRASLLKAIEKITLAEYTLDFQYERKR